MGTLNERSGEYRIAREKMRKRALCIIAVIIFAALAGYIAYFIWNGIRNKEYHGYKIISHYDRTDKNAAKYISYGNNILKYSNDGASALNREGEPLWNGSFDMRNPMVDCSGDYVAIADNGGKEIYVFSGSDAGVTIETPLPVRAVRVASQGVVAAVLDDVNSNSVCLYDPYSTSEKLLAQVPTNVSSDGYPVDIALSSDGKSLATAYICVTGGVTQSRICFCNFSEVGKDKNIVVGGGNYDDSIAVKLEFIDDNTVCVMLDNGFSLYENMKQPKETCKELFDKEIKSVVIDKGYVGFIFKGSDEDAQQEMKLYNASGKNILDQKADYQYEQVYMEDGEIIFLSNKGCTIMRTDGVCKFDGTFDTGVNYLYGTGSSNTYYMIDDNNINIIELTEDVK